MREIVLSDRHDLWSQDSEGTDKEESVNGESEEDVSEKFDLCLKAFDSLDLRDLNLELFKKCMRRQIEAPCIVFKSHTDILKILSNAPVNCRTVLYDEDKLGLGKTKFRLGGEVSIRRTYQCKMLRNLPIDFCCFVFVNYQLQDVVHNIFLVENNKCYGISFTRLEAQLLHYSLCCQEC